MEFSPHFCGDENKAVLYHKMGSVLCSSDSTVYLLDLSPDPSCVTESCSLLWCLLSSTSDASHCINQQSTYHVVVINRSSPEQKVCKPHDSAYNCPCTVPLPCKAFLPAWYVQHRYGTIFCKYIVSMQADVTHPLSFLCCLSSLQQIFSGLNLLTVMVRVPDRLGTMQIWSVHCKQQTDGLQWQNKAWYDNLHATIGSLSDWFAI
jgi:hypothetical protein